MTTAGTAPFRDLYCQAKGCRVEQFERRLFREGLYRRSLVLGLVIHCLKPSFFALELRLVRQLGAATTREKFRAEIEDYRGTIRRQYSRLRIWMHLRFAAQHLLKYAVLLPAV
ncbi:MAG: hypothetical protein L0Z50_02765 [Verrucomicrobiales bacterium]|nr:hypothetical protein [Verrucomicrobiales bacterium]